MLNATKSSASDSSSRKYVQREFHILQGQYSAEFAERNYVHATKFKVQKEIYRHKEVKNME